MMDANGDYRAQRSPDISLANFITNSHLIDPFYDKFNSCPRTYLYGSKRIDYILIDPALSLSIRSVGYLGTHMGADSDHCMAFIDFDERQLFNGIINRPVPHHSREILIAQTDKVQEFTRGFEAALDDHSFPERVAKLAAAFARNAASDVNIQSYNDLYGEFLDMAKSTAKKVGRKKYGYNRSPTLTTAGQLLLIHKHAYDCKRRHAPLTKSIISRCNTHDVSIARLQEMTIPDTEGTSTLTTGTLGGDQAQRVVTF
jgi:hypothetical protein